MTLLVSHYVMVTWKMTIGVQYPCCDWRAGANQPSWVLHTYVVSNSTCACANQRTPFYTVPYMFDSYVNVFHVSDSAWLLKQLTEISTLTRLWALNI